MDMEEINIPNSLFCSSGPTPNGGQQLTCVSIGVSFWGRERWRGWKVVPEGQREMSAQLRWSEKGSEQFSDMCLSSPGGGDVLTTLEGQQP